MGVVLIKIWSREELFAQLLTVSAPPVRVALENVSELLFPLAVKSMMLADPNVNAPKLALRAAAVSLTASVVSLK